MVTVVRDAMTPDVVSVPPDMGLRDVASLLSQRRISGVPVTNEDGCVLGVISEADLVVKQLGKSTARRTPLEWIFGERLSADEIRRRSAACVAQAMTAPAITIEPDRPLRDAAALIVDREVNRLPVTENGHLIGIITRADLVRAYLKRDERALRAIREDVMRATMWLDPDELSVEVRDGVARVSGIVDRRSTATILEKLIALVEGVDRLESHLAWQLDDSGLERMIEGEAASLIARERARSVHR